MRGEPFRMPGGNNNVRGQQTMSQPDRAAFIAALEELGGGDDETVLAAARRVEAQRRAAGLDWDDLLSAEADWPEGRAVPVAAEGGAESLPDDDGALVAMLLARGDISDGTRETLADIQGSITRGELDQMDRDYLRALANRLAG